MLKSVRSISDVAFLQPGLDQLKVSDLSFQGKENICAECSHQPVTKRTGLRQSDNVMFSLPYPGYLQQNRDNGGSLVHGLCAPEK